MPISTKIDGEQMIISQDLDSENGYTSSHSPERNLFAAVMATAIHDLQRWQIECVNTDIYKRIIAKHYELSLEWFADIGDSPIPFDMACEVLGLRKGAIIASLIRQGVLPAGGPLQAIKEFSEIEFESTPEDRQVAIFEN